MNTRCKQRGQIQAICSRSWDRAAAKLLQRHTVEQEDGDQQRQDGMVSYQGGHGNALTGGIGLLPGHVDGGDSGFALTGAGNQALMAIGKREKRASPAPP